MLTLIPTKTTVRVNDDGWWNFFVVESVYVSDDRKLVAPEMGPTKSRIKRLCWPEKEGQDFFVLFEDGKRAYFK